MYGEEGDRKLSKTYIFYCRSCGLRFESVEQAYDHSQSKFKENDKSHPIQDAPFSVVIAIKAETPTIHSMEPEK